MSSENYVQFIRDVDNIVSEANSSIDELRQEIDRLEAKRSQIENDIGKSTLDDFRSNSVSRYHYDVLEIRVIADDIIEKKQTMFERAMVRGDLHYVARQKIKPVLDSLDAQQIRADVYEQMNELTEKRLDNQEERLMNKIENLDSKVESTRSDMARQLRDVRETSRRESQENGGQMIGFMKKVIGVLESSDLDSGNLEQHIENVNQGEKIDGVDLSSDQAGESSGDESEDDEEETMSTADKVRRDLRKLENEDDFELESQSDIAREHDVSPQRVSNIKKSMDL